MHNYELKARLASENIPEWVRTEVDRLIEEVICSQNQLFDYIIDAVEQECSTRERGIYTHAGIWTRMMWLEYLVVRGVMRQIEDSDQYEYVHARSFFKETT